MPTWLIWVIVIVVVLVVIGAVVSMMSKRRTEQHRAHADELRAEASAKAGGLTESQRQAEDARAKAELAQSEAQRTQERAAQAEQGHQVEQAGYEDKLREADRLDPDVEHQVGGLRAERLERRERCIRPDHDGQPPRRGGDDHGDPRRGHAHPHHRVT